MTIPATGARASRRAASTAARQNIEAQPKTETPEVLEDLTDEEAFGAEDLPTQEAPPRGVQQYAPPQGGALVQPQEDLTRKIDVGDLIIPKLRLSQAMSKTNTLFSTSRGKEGVGMGNWYVTTNNEDLGDTVYFIPVDMKKSRALFVQGQGLMCRSFDLLNGEGDPGGACEGSMQEMHTLPADRRGCPLRLWNDRTPPKCGITYNYPGLVIRASEIETPSKARPIQAILQLRSAATKPAKILNTARMNEGGGRWHTLIMELTVESMTNTKGTFFNPVINYHDTTDAEGFERIARRATSMARQMGDQNLTDSLEDDSLS